MALLRREYTEFAAAQEQAFGDASPTLLQRYPAKVAKVQFTMIPHRLYAAITDLGNVFGRTSASVADHHKGDIFLAAVENLKFHSVPDIAWQIK